jgi:site-specific recombinase XerD
MRHTDAGASAPRLALPSWRIAREATLTDLCTAFVDRCRAEGLSPATERYYRQAGSHWLRFCEPLGLTDPRAVSPDHLTDYASWLQARGNGKQSVATRLRGIRALLSWAELRGYIELSRFRMWKLKQPKLPAQRGFSGADVRRMIDIAGKQALNSLRDAAILLLLFDTAERAERSAVLLTTNLPFSEWTQVIPNARLCKAVLDRITDRAHIIETGADSFRFKRTLAQRQRKTSGHDEHSVE